MKLPEKLGSLPKRPQFAAYCRGPYCVMAYKSVEIFAARRISRPPPRWRVHGMASSRAAVRARRCPGAHRSLGWFAGGGASNRRCLTLAALFQNFVLAAERVAYRCRNGPDASPAAHILLQDQPKPAH